MNRYFLGLLAIVALFVVLIILAIPSGHKVPKTNKSLSSYSNTDAIARLTIEGPVVAASQHTEIRIEVGRDNVTYKQITGYNGQVVNQKTFTNTEASYNVFLRALFYAGFTMGDTNPALSDERGRCATGDVYVFELENGGSDVERFWSTDCGGIHTYNGDPNQTLTIFQNQVPNYSDLTSSLNL
jgi:hypothetical protein